jgi:hypothetical protein
MQQVIPPRARHTWRVEAFMFLLNPLAGRRLMALAVLALAAGSRTVWAQDLDAPDEHLDVPAGGAVEKMAPGWANADQFDQWVFNRQGGAASARSRLETMLALHIDELNRACGLSPAQVRKLQLAGRGDVKRFFDRVEEAKRRFLVSPNNPNNNIWNEINPLQTAINVGLFGEDSIFAKTIKTTLSAEQSARYADIQRQRTLLRYRTTIDWWVVQVDKALGLSDQQRRQLAALLVSEGRPPRRFGQGDFWYIMLQAARLPEAKLKSILDDVQWRLIRNQLNQARAMEQWLRQSGVLPDDSSGPERAKAARAVRPASVRVPVGPGPGADRKQQRLVAPQRRQPQVKHHAQG